MTTYADDAKWYRTPMLEQEEVAAGTFRVRLECPEIAGNSIPGQFVMLRIASLKDPLIGRALAVFDTYGPESGRLGIDLIYVAKGKFTSCLAQCRPGQELEVWGPLGNGFSREPVDHLILVAGGVGETPMLGLGREALGALALEINGMGSRRNRLRLRKKSPFATGHALRICWLASNNFARLASTFGSARTMVRSAKSSVLPKRSWTSCRKETLARRESRVAAPNP